MSSYKERLAEREDFREGLEQELCPSWVPQSVRDLVWSHAWESGHSYGHDMVKQEYDERMDVVRMLCPKLEIPS